jgi:hypothetical protein
LRAFIVAKSENPPDATLEMLNDSERFNRSMYGNEAGHKQWRSFTEKLAMEHAGLHCHRWNEADAMPPRVKLSAF